MFLLDERQTAIVVDAISLFNPCCKYVILFRSFGIRCISQLMADVNLLLLMVNAIVNVFLHLSFHPFDYQGRVCFPQPCDCIITRSMSYKTDSQRKKVYSTQKKSVCFCSEYITTIFWGIFAHFSLLEPKDVIYL